MSVNVKELGDCVNDLAWTIKRIVLLLPRIHPSPDVAEATDAVQRRLDLIAQRLGDGE